MEGETRLNEFVECFVDIPSTIMHYTFSVYNIFTLTGNSQILVLRYRFENKKSNISCPLSLVDSHVAPGWVT